MTRDQGHPWAVSRRIFGGSLALPTTDQPALQQVNPPDRFSSTSSDRVQGYLEQATRPGSHRKNRALQRAL
jgi:hypothetical protein